MRIKLPKIEVDYESYSITRERLWSNVMLGIATLGCLIVLGISAWKIIHLGAC